MLTLEKSRGYPNPQLVKKWPGIVGAGWVGQGEAGQWGLDGPGL